jgi:AcrR family transcriptional regulator
VTGWLGDQRAELATERILDAAASVFEARGATGASMEDVARAAGCSRATVYRYFEDRDALRLAFVHRETRRVGAEVAAKVAHIDDPQARVVAAIVAALAAVRGRPPLLSWFTAANASVTRELVRASPVIHGLAASLLAGTSDSGNSDAAESAYRARWLVHTVVSLLVLPGADANEEHALLQRFVAPVVAPLAGSPGPDGPSAARTQLGLT